MLVVVCLSLSSCISQRPIEEQAIVIVIGADVNQLNPNLVDLTFGIPLFEQSKRSFARLTTTSAANYGEALDLWQAGSALRVATGKVRLLLFGEEMAQRGLPAFINYVQVPRVDNNALVAVARGRAEEMLHGHLTETERIGTNTANQLQTAHQEGLTFKPEVNDLITTFLTAGLDPIMPLLDISNGQDVIYLVGSALFNDLNMVGEINLRETQLLLALQGKVQEVTYPLALGPTAELMGQELHLRLIGSRAKLLPRLENGRLVVKVQFEANYNLRNYYSVTDITRPQPAAQITQELESNINLAIQQLLAKLQAAKTDPLGIGKKFRVKNNQTYDDNTFRELWANAQLEISVDLQFIRGGTNVQTERKQP